MPVKVAMPKLGLTMVEGKIVEWKKRVGEQVEKGEIIFVVETEKVTYEVESPATGVLGKILAKQDETIPVGGLVGYILQPGEEVSDLPEVPARTQSAELAGTKTEVLTVRPQIIEADVKISPLARKIAEEHNINISKVKGTGPGGRIVKEDILQAVEQTEKATLSATMPASEETSEEAAIIPLTPMRKTIARRLTESFTTVPHMYLYRQVDVFELRKCREQLLSIIESKVGVKLTFTDLLVKIVAKTLEDHPQVNSSYNGSSIKLFKRIHIGLATSLEGGQGLIVPVIRDANKKTIAEVCVARAQIVQKARERKVTPEEISGSTFTITNTGMYGSDFSAPIINPPEAAILGVGGMKDKPAVVDGQIVVRPLMFLSLSIDHRVLDGADGWQFLATLKKYIENPFSLMV